MENSHLTFKMKNVNLALILQLVREETNLTLTLVIGELINRLKLFMSVFTNKLVKEVQEIIFAKKVIRDLFAEHVIW